jgi:hypothetical protein
MVSMREIAMLAGTKATLLAAPLLFSLLLGSGVAAAQDDAFETYGDDYRSGDYGRVRDAAQGLTILRAQWNQQQGVVDEGFVNSPVFPGDEITTGDEQRVEVELAGGTLVWVDGRTELNFLALPDPYADVADHAVLQLSAGRIRLATSLRDDEELRVDTPAASVYPLGDADLRIEVGRDGWTRVYSRRGVVEVVGDGASVLVRGGTRTDVEPGALPYEPEPFNTFSADGFDRYVERREDVYRYREGYAGGPDVYRELPDEIQPYYRELSAHGAWVYVDEYGYVWQPAGVAADWRPYYNGYWGYGPNGYFWVSHEPWGWAPYHYGRWSWVGGYGWCWSPGRVFAGAWVSWSWGSVYVGWSPLDYWGYPAYRSAWYHGYYDPYCWSFIGYHHIHHHRYYNYYVPWDHVKHGVHRSAVVTRPPRVAPDRLASSADARKRAVSDARGDSRHRIAPGERSRPAGRGFRTTENRLDRRDRTARPGRDGPPAPEGRARRTPTSRTSPDVRGPGRRGDSVRGGGRERLPVVTEPRQRRGLAPEKTERSVRPGRERSSVSGARSRTEGSSTPEARDNRQGRDDRVRDLYRKMAKPRQTREQPSATSPRGKSAPSRARPTKPIKRSEPSRARPSKPERSRPKASGGSRAKPKSSGKKKSRSSLHSSSRQPRTKQVGERVAVSAPDPRPRREHVSRDRSTHRRTIRQPSTPAPRERSSASIRRDAGHRSSPSASRTSAPRQKRSVRSTSGSTAPKGKSVARPSRSSRSPERSVKSSSRGAAPKSRGSSRRGSGGGRGRGSRR